MPTTTFMGLVLPDVSSTPGPTWASLLNAAATILDAHDHTTGSGVQVPSAGLNINADLETNGFNLTELRSTRYANQSLFSLSSDNLSLWFSSGELYARDGSGNNVKITNAGSVNVAGSNGIGGDYGSPNPASVIYTDASDLYSFLTDPGVFAEMKFRGFESVGKMSLFTTAVSSSPYTISNSASNTDCILLVNTTAGRTINMPDPTTQRRVIIIKDVSGQSETNNITVAPFAAETFDGVAGSQTLAANYGTWILVSNLTNWFFLKNDQADPAAIDSEVYVHTGTTYPAVDTKIRRWTTAAINNGTAITYADNANTGGSFTINESGIYALSYGDVSGGTASSHAITVNDSSTLSTTWTAGNYGTGVRAFAQSTATTKPDTAAITMRLAATDVVKGHHDGNVSAASALSFFSIVQLTRE